MLDRDRLERESRAAWENAARQWDASYLAAHQEHERNRAHFLEDQRKRNKSVLDFRARFEEGVPKAIEEYCAAVFERSSYPEYFFVEHLVAYDRASTTVVVDLQLPAPDDVPNIEGYRFIATRNEAKPQYLKKKVFEELYDQALKQCVVRTIHEVFEAAYTDHVQAVVVNGWVTSVDKATGNDVTSCVISVSSERGVFESFDLSRIDVSECVKALKGLVAGPLSGVAPVKPIMFLDRRDSRFVESREVLAELNSEANLAEMPWEDFEHLVRELFAGLFSGEDSEVNVTQASRDKGVDAIAFDPDPIRGGKFVIQAKRYTNVVPVSAVRDLYGTMIAEGAARGILVTTSHYGRDARQFAKDKPITLMDGPNLVHLLEQQGHKVRLDVAAARAKRN